MSSCNPPASPSSSLYHPLLSHFPTVSHLPFLLCSTIDVPSSLCLRELNQSAIPRRSRKPEEGNLPAPKDIALHNSLLDCAALRLYGFPLRYPQGSKLEG